MLLKKIFFYSKSNSLLVPQMNKYLPVNIFFSFIYLSMFLGLNLWIILANALRFQITSFLLQLPTKLQTFQFVFEVFLSEECYNLHILAELYKDSGVAVDSYQWPWNTVLYRNRLPTGICFWNNSSKFEILVLFISLIS